jgi:hypothetical protein
MYLFLQFKILWRTFLRDTSPISVYSLKSIVGYFNTSPVLAPDFPGSSSTSFSIQLPYSPLSVCVSACLPACLSVCLSVCLSIYLSIYLSVYGSTVLLLDLSRFFNFFILNTVGMTPWVEDRPVVRLLHTHRTTQIQNKHTQYRHPCLEWDSKPRSQCSSERMEFMP